MDPILRVAGWGAIAALLITPAVMMQVSDGWNWNAGDFVFAGVVLGGAGLICEAVARRSRDWRYRVGAGAAIAALVGLIWVNGAVGIIGSEDHPANWLYAGVIAIAVLGAVAARFKAKSVAVTMLAASAAQVAIGAAAIIGGYGRGEPNWPWDIAGATVIFGVLWLTSAALFHASARRR